MVRKILICTSLNLKSKSMPINSLKKKMKLIKSMVVKEKLMILRLYNYSKYSVYWYTYENVILIIFEILRYNLSTFILMKNELTLKILILCYVYTTLP